jgi:hypothetical protein
VEDHVRELFGDGVSDLRAETHVQPVDHFADPQALATYYRDNFGPVIAAYANVGDDDARRAELDAALLGFAERTNVAAPGSAARWDFEYLLIVARRA